MSNDDDETLRNQLFVIRLGELLDEGRLDDAEKIFEESNIRGDLTNVLWEIFPLVTGRLTSASENNDSKLFAICERFLEVLAKKCNPKETLLLLVERIEDTRNDDSFRSLLRSLGVALSLAGPSKTFDWCVKSVESYVQHLPCPENLKPSDNGKDRTNEDPIAARLRSDYEAILQFLEPVVKLSALPRAEEIKTRNRALGFHLSLFGIPFCYLQCESKKKLMNNQISLFENALAQISLLTGDLFRYHSIIDDLCRGRKVRIIDDEENDGNNAIKILCDKRKVTDLAWANYYYYVLNTATGLNGIPRIYNFRYLMHGIFYAANVFLSQAEYILVRKGLKIIEAVLVRVDERSVNREILEITVHQDLFKSLAQVMIYCDSDKDRKLALKQFHDYIDIFDYEARYLVITNLYETVNHSGIFSLLTSLTKKSIIDCLEMKLNFFSFDRLERLMKRICRLPNGASSDLVEISDEIISALNLVRFLIIRDRYDDTGIRRIVQDLEKNYLLPLREGIELSRAHWTIKIKDLEERPKNVDSAGGMDSVDREITLTVGGQTLPMMPVEGKIKFCHQAIGALDVMESILARVNECIEENRGKKIRPVHQPCS